MSMLDRVKNAVLGNPVEREYEIGKHIASAGPQLQWKVHQGTRKNTQKAVSVFIFQKKSPTIDKMSKRSRETLFEVMRRGPQQLAKLRHPLLLTIDHPLEETRDMLVFVTEPVQCCLSNVLGNYTNIPQPLPFAIKNFEMDDIEIRIGMLGVLGGLQFLHQDAKLVHGNVTPESVMIVQSGAWKLAGFHFHAFLRYQQQQGVQVQEYDSKASSSEPNLDYVSPERVLHKTIDTMADIWSYGIMLHSVYNKGQVPAASNNNLLSYKQNIEVISRMSSSGFNSIPHDCRDHLKQCLSMEPSLRPDALACAKISFYNDNRLQILQYLETLVQRPDLEKSQFFKNLHRVLGKLPKRVTLNRVLPAVFEEFKKPTMIPFALPNVLMVAQDCTLDEYAVHIWPQLKATFILHEPIQIMLLLLQKMDLLLTKTPQHDIKHHILPMIYRALESDNQVIQELVVTILPNFASMVDYSSLKNHMVPRITNLCLSTTFLKIRVNALVCIGRILEHMDKWMVQDQILPVLQKIPSREAGVLMAILGIYREVLNNKKLGLEKVQIASIVLPFLVPLSVESSLNASQFGTFMSVIRDMLHALEMEHMAQLKEAGQMQDEVAASLQYAQEAEDAKAMDDMIDRMEDMFAAPASSAPPPATAAQPAMAAANPAAAMSLSSTNFQGAPPVFGITPTSSGGSNGGAVPQLQPPPASAAPTGSGGIISSSGPAGPSLNDIFGGMLEPVGAARPAAPAAAAAPVANALDENPFAMPGSSMATAPAPAMAPSPAMAPAPAPAASWSSGLQQQAAVAQQRQDEERERERQRKEEERRREEERRQAIQEQQRQEEERKRQEQQKRQEEERRKQEEERRRQQMEQQRLQQQQQQSSTQGWGSSMPAATTTSSSMGWSGGMQSQGMSTASQSTAVSSSGNSGGGGWSSGMAQPMQPQSASSQMGAFSMGGMGSGQQQPMQPMQAQQQPMQPLSASSLMSQSQPMQPMSASSLMSQSQPMQPMSASNLMSQSQQPMQPTSGFGQAQQPQQQNSMMGGFGQQPMQPMQPTQSGFGGQSSGVGGGGQPARLQQQNQDMSAAFFGL